jgi:hypothetical protein
MRKSSCDPIVDDCSSFKPQRTWLVMMQSWRASWYGCWPNFREPSMPKGLSKTEAAYLLRDSSVKKPWALNRVG